MDWKKIALLGGAAVGVALLVRHLGGRTANSDVHASGAVNQAVEEAMQAAREAEAQMNGFGALPPWPGIGPTPHPSLGPIWSTTNWSVTWR
jgi:hypothetical protein